MITLACSVALGAEFVTVKVDDIGGSPRVRLSTHSVANPDTLQRELWTLRSDGTQGRYIEKQVVLNETANERLQFVVFNPPLLSRREALIRSRRIFNPSTGAWHVRVCAEAGAAPTEQAIRVKAIESEWHFLPDGHGGTDVQYVTRVDFGFPSWVVAGFQPQIALEALREVITRAELSSISP